MLLHMCAHICELTYSCEHTNTHVYTLRLTKGKVAVKTPLVITRRCGLE